MSKNRNHPRPPAQSYAGARIIQPQGQPSQEDILKQQRLKHVERHVEAIAAGIYANAISELNKQVLNPTFRAEQCQSIANQSIEDALLFARTMWNVSMSRHQKPKPVVPFQNDEPSFTPPHVPPDPAPSPIVQG